MIPPVTMLAVPMVSRTKPQKMPACISPARGSLNIFVWTKAYWIRPANRAGMSANGLGPLGAGRGEDPQVARHREHEEGGRAPEDREDQRVERDVGERLEHQARHCRRARGRTGRPASRARGRAPARWRRAIRGRPSGCPAG